jgi:hypothetical protein
VEQQYELKSLANNQVKIQLKNFDCYRTNAKTLAEKRTKFHTHKPKEERNYRVITKKYALLHYPRRHRNGNGKTRALKPIWTYGIQLWGTASTSNIQILERSQSKTLRMTVDVPWYMPNTAISKGSPNTNSKRKNPSLKFSIQCSPHRTPKWSNQTTGDCEDTCLPDSCCDYYICNCNV